MKQNILRDVDTTSGCKTLIALMVSGVAKKYALLGSIVQFMSVIGAKKRKIGTAKDSKMRVIWSFVKKLEIRRLVGKR